MRQLNFIFTTILVVVLSYIAADLLWLVWKPEVGQASTVAVKKTPLQQISLPTDIFGKRQVIPVKTPAKKVKQSKLNLELIGVLFKHKDPFAIIAPVGQLSLAKTYQVGDTVKTGVLVHDIGADFVLLKRGDKLEKLLFKKANNAANIISNRGKGPKKSSQSKLSPVQRSTVNEYRVEIVNNPKKLLSLVSVVPFFENGQMLGVKVKPGKDRAIFQALGFKSGDVITKINNINIDNFNKFAKIRQMIYDNLNFDLSVKRDDRIVHLSIQL